LGDLACNITGGENWKNFITGFWLYQASIKGKNDVCVMLLQQGADPTLRNSEGKTALDVADPLTRPVLSEADYRKDELLEVARSGEWGQTHGTGYRVSLHK
jgi:hypothetical protein